VTTTIPSSTYLCSPTTAQTSNPTIAIAITAIPSSTSTTASQTTAPTSAIATLSTSTPTTAIQVSTTASQTTTPTFAITTLSTLTPTTAIRHSSPDRQEEVKVPNMKVWLAHDVLAFIAWGVLFPCLSSLFRDRFPKGPLWFNLHRNVSTGAFVLVIALFSIAVSYTTKEGTRNFKSSHRRMGLAMFILTTIQMLRGIIVWVAAMTMTILVGIWHSIFLKAKSIDRSGNSNSNNPKDSEFDVERDDDDTLI
jgi:hypothetical protein